MKPRRDNPAVPRLTVTVPEAAAMLGLGVSSTRRLINEGRLESLRVGTRLVVPLAAVDLLLGAGTRGMAGAQR